MKAEILKMYGSLLLVGAVIWVGFRALPYAGFRYMHPEMTETQLQIYFLGQLCWWDMVPFLLFSAGMVLLYRGEK